ncbi:ABC transporter permease [Gemmobacter sp. 24YEA27]|uniref:ABC transporter permease n=1 Tax=Gemmobacter sp. 24YEA27 TaxID=3040672 RepID=UPI0024B38452|nr:ABC transporter permease [Gemmobacter sp. 24YEA27]
MKHFNPGKLILGLTVALIALWLLAPTIVVVPMSFADKKSLAFPPSGFSLKWYENFFTNPQWFNSFTTSLKVAVMVSVVATVIGTMAAIGIERMKSRAAGLIRMLLITPMVVPGVVLAVGVYAVYLTQGLVGTWTGYVLAHTLLAIPFVVIAVGANLSVFDQRLETAAASLGANRLTTFFTVTLPLIRPGILSGALFAFVTSFDEVIVSLFITSPQLKTLPVQIFSSMTRDADPTVAAVGSLIFLTTTLVIGLGLIFGTRKGRKS